MNFDELKQYAADNQNRIELRSGRVRNLIGEVPPLIVRMGNVLLILVLALLFLVGYYVPFPWKMEIKVSFQPETGIMYLPVRNMDDVKEAMETELNFDIYQGMDSAAVPVKLVPLQKRVVSNDGRLLGTAEAAFVQPNELKDFAFWLDATLIIRRKSTPLLLRFH